MFVFNQLKEDLLKVSENFILKEYDQHNHNTPGTKKTLLDVQIKTHRNMVQTRQHQNPCLTGIIFLFYGNKNLHNEHKKSVTCHHDCYECLR